MLDRRTLIDPTSILLFNQYYVEEIGCCMNGAESQAGISYTLLPLWS